MPNKIQREIDEILSGLEGFPPKRSVRSRLGAAVTSFWRGLRGLGGGLPRPRFSAGQLLLLAGAIIVIAYVLDIGSGDVNRLIIGAGLGLFILAFVLSLRRQSRPPEKLWRGEPLELHGPSVGTRFRSWWGRWRSRR